MVICLERGADLHMAQLMPLPLTVSCSSKVQIGFTFLLPAHPGSPGQRAVKWVCVCVNVSLKSLFCCKIRVQMFTCNMWHFLGRFRFVLCLLGLEDYLQFACYPLYESPNVRHKSICLLKISSH